MRLITDSPYAAGTPEHDHWVRTVFIPGVRNERMVEDRAKYGAASIGADVTYDLGEDDTPEVWPDSPFLSGAREVSASGYARGGTGKSSGIFAAAADKVITLSMAFKDLNVALMQAFGFSDEQIRAAEQRRRRDEEERQWMHVPAYVWERMDRHHRASLGKVCVWHPNGSHKDRYYDHGELLPEYGPPKPENREARRMRVMPPLMPPRLCPLHGQLADRCGPCRREIARIRHV